MFAIRRWKVGAASCCRLKAFHGWAEAWPQSASGGNN
jgi:hypothetical protein